MGRVRPGARKKNKGPCVESRRNFKQQTAVESPGHGGRVLFIRQNI